jgi:hypothetical protein
MVVGDQLHALPVGSTLDTRNGKFYWIPGIAFSGMYRLVFIEKEKDGKIRCINVFVNIGPKS